MSFNRAFAGPVAALLCLAGAACSAQESRASAESRPTAARNGARLVVLVVVDQLSTDVLRSAWPHCGPDGFRRIAREGADFAEAAFDFACTETAPGHATIGTGTTPNVHGIMANGWPNPETGVDVNAVYDGSAAIGPPPEAKASGASTSRLKVPTFGDALKEAYGPAAKVAGFSLKARSALLTTGRRADVAAWLDYEIGWWTASPDQGPALPPYLAASNAEDRVARLFGAPWSKEDPASAFADLGPDLSPFEYGLDGRTDFPHRLDHPGGAEVERKKRAQIALISPAGNDLVVDAALAALDALALGKDDVPDLLYVGFSANDLVGHAYGPQSHEVRAITLATDRRLAALMRTLDEKVGVGRWNLGLTSDHGVGPTPERAVKEGLPAGRVDGRRTRGAAETALTQAFGDPAPQNWTLAQSGGFLVLNHALAAARGVDRDRAAEIAATAAASVKGVGRAIPLRRALAKGPADAFEAFVLASMAPDRMPDVYVVPAPYHLFSTNPASHGTPYPYDRRVPVMLSGPGVRAGVAPQDVVSPASLVVTMAALLGVPKPSGATAPVLTAALR